ncbi:17545_t:CDS:2 [Rhizophagus irregularis]|nr:17545_t:CDS:2 [Rhizophagus irregularis]
MTRGYSLEQDLRLLINNQKYSDVEIICEDEKKLHGCRAILAARSEVFDRLLYNGMKESYEKEISFPKINSIGMEMILEYIYTGSIKEESLTKDNMIEIFYAADYFQLTELQNFIMKTFKNTLKKNYTENYSPELLSKFAEKIPLTENNILLNLLVEAVSIIPLNRIEFGRLSISGLQYLLTCTHEEGTPFATPEYEVFRYSAILTAKQVSDNAYKALMKQRIEGQILTDVIEPLEIISEKIILDVYRQKAKLNESDLNNIRGIPIPVCVWDDTACGSKLIFENNGKIVRLQSQTKSSRNVKAKMILEDKGIFEWDFIIEKACGDAWVGVCSPENLNYEFFAGKQPVGWVLGTKGRCYNSGNYINNYCPSFGDGARITVHLDMNKRTCAFTVNGTKYKEVTEWNNLPSKLYPVASLCYPGRFRIEPHQKYI